MYTSFLSSNEVQNSDVLEKDTYEQVCLDLEGSDSGGISPTAYEIA